MRGSRVLSTRLFERVRPTIGVTMSVPKPQTRAPELEVDTLGNGGWKLSDRKPDRFTMIVFYRGVHCPVCTTYIGELQDKLGDFTSRGVDVIAVSGDTRERAERSKSEWGLDNLTVGYDISTDVMRDWGLFVSSGIKDEEPDVRRAGAVPDQARRQRVLRRDQQHAVRAAEARRHAGRRGLRHRERLSGAR